MISSLEHAEHPLYHGRCAFCEMQIEGYVGRPQEAHESADGEERAMQRTFKPRDLRMLEAYRESRGLSQTQLAMRSGVTQGDISRLERGVMNTRGVTATKLAVALGVDIEDLEGTS